MLWGSMIKQTMQRKRPSFSEGYYGYGSFSELLEDAQEKEIIPHQEGPAFRQLRGHGLRSNVTSPTSTLRRSSSIMTSIEPCERSPQGRQ